MGIKTLTFLLNKLRKEFKFFKMNIEKYYLPQLDLVLQSEEGGDLSGFMPNGDF